MEKRSGYNIIGESSVRRIRRFDGLDMCILFALKKYKPGLELKL